VINLLLCAPPSFRPTPAAAPHPIRNFAFYWLSEPFPFSVIFPRIGPDGLVFFLIRNPVIADTMMRPSIYYVPGLVLFFFSSAFLFPMQASLASFTDLARCLSSPFPRDAVPKFPVDSSAGLMLVFSVSFFFLATRPGPKSSPSPRSSQWL